MGFFFRSSFREACCVKGLVVLGGRGSKGGLGLEHSLARCIVKSLERSRKSTAAVRQHISGLFRRSVFFVHIGLAGGRVASARKYFRIKIIIINFKCMLILGLGLVGPKG